MRNYGEEQPYISLGIFKLRLPFIHYRWEMPEAIQGLLMCAACLSAIPVLTEVLGIPFDIAWAIVIINGLLYSLHPLLGDPIVCGWITPAIPLVIMFLNKYPIGNERIQALIALQFLVACIFIFMGKAKIISKLVYKVPNSLKAGILLGAGVSAVLGEFKVGGRIEIYPISIIIGCIIAYYILFSRSFTQLRQKNKFFFSVGKYGMVSAIIVALIIGPIVGEIAIPSIELGSIIYVPDFNLLLDTVSPFRIGMPSIDIFISAIPMAAMIYIIAFSDFITAQALLKEGSEIRKDELIDVNSDRSNLICGIRNLIMSLFAPFIQLCGPLSAAVTASIVQRYKDGRENMDSIFSATGTFRVMSFIGVTLIPLVNLLEPVLPIALSLMMLVQGYICTKLAMSLCKTDSERGIAGVMGAVLAAKGALFALIIGAILNIILKENDKNKEELAA